MATSRALLRCTLPLALALAIGSAEAQVTKGGIRGIVRDETGAVLAGVTVEATSPARIGQPAVEVTNKQGLYRFDGFSVGVYTVTFSLSGFATIRRENVRVEVGRSTQLDMTLNLAGTQETVTVTAASPVVDTVHADYSTNFAQELVKNVPTTRNSYFDIITSVPGVKADHEINVSRFSIYGSSTDQNAYQMDGVDVSAPSYGGPWDYPNFDLIQEVEVLGVGASAEFSGFQGGVVNIVTKSGSNQWRGVGSAFLVNDWMVGNNTPDEPYPVRTDYATDLTFQLGGPIIQDRLWVIGLIQNERSRGVPVGVELTPDVLGGSEIRTFFKVNAQLSQNDNFEFSTDDNNFDTPNAPSRTSPPETTTHEHGHNPVLSARWTHTFSDSTLLEVKGGGIYIRDREDSLYDNFDTSGRSDLGTGFDSANAMGTWRSHQSKTQAAVALTHYADDFIKGSHDFKFGAQLLRSQDLSYWSYFNNVFYYDYNDAPYYAMFSDPSAYGATIDNTAVFANDNWTVSSRVALNLGVRFDHMVGGVPETAQLDPHLKSDTGVTFPGQAGLIRFNNVSPRVGISVQLDSSGKTVAKANYGRFYGKILGNWISRLSDGNTNTDAFLYNDTTGAYDIPFWSFDPNINIGIDPNLQNQYTDQIYFGLERELSPDFGLDASFIYKNEANFVRVKDVGGQYQPMPYEDTFNGATQTLSVYNRVTPSSESLYLGTNRTDFDQSYKSFVLQANKRFSGNWLLNGSYQWQRSLGYAGGGIGTSAQTFSSLSSGSFGRDPNDLINAYGRLPADSTNTAKVSLAFEAPWGIVTGVRYTFESGRPFGRVINVRGLNQGSRRVLAEPRGTYELEAQHDLSIRLDKDLRFAENRNLRISIDIFNLLNRSNAINIRNNSTEAKDDFLQPTKVVGPRRAMFGIRFEF